MAGTYEQALSVVEGETSVHSGVSLDPCQPEWPLSFLIRSDIDDLPFTSLNHLASLTHSRGNDLSKILPSVLPSCIGKSSLP